MSKLNCLVCQMIGMGLRLNSEQGLGALNMDHVSEF